MILVAIMCTPCPIVGQTAEADAVKILTEIDAVFETPGQCSVLMLKTA